MISIALPLLTLLDCEYAEPGTKSKTSKILFVIILTYK